MNKEEKKDNELTLVTKEFSLPEAEVNPFIEQFSQFLEDAKLVRNEVKGLVVTDVGQVDLMQKARDKRLILKNIRVSTENKRKELKENSIRIGKAIDGMANIIKAIIVPLEEHLEQQEKYAEIIEAQKKEQRYKDRTEKLLKYIEDVSFYNYSEMSDEVFENLLETVKQTWQIKENNRIAEEKRLEEEKAKLIILEKRKFEIQEYKNFFGPDTELTLETTQEGYEAILLILVGRKTDWDLKQKEIEKENARLKAIQLENEKKIQEEKEANEKLAKELQDKQDKEDARIKAEEADKKKKLAEEEQKKKEEQEAERQKALAPEKDKLLEYAETIRTLKAPEGLSKAGLEIVKKVEAQLLAISQDIKVDIKNI